MPRSLGGCDEPDCVMSLCPLHYRRYDRGQLDLLPHLVAMDVITSDPGR